MTEPNRVLLQKTLERIRENPDRWNQAVYRYQPDRGGAWVGCYGAHAADLAGGVWSGHDYLIAEPEDDPARIHDGVVHLNYRARRILGLTHDQAYDLFAPSNNFRYIEQAVRELCDGTAPDSPDEETRLRRELHAVDSIEPEFPRCPYCLALKWNDDHRCVED
jgi:hypothetical protein